MNTGGKDKAGSSWEMMEEEREILVDVSASSGVAPRGSSVGRA